MHGGNLWGINLRLSLIVWHWFQFKTPIFICQMGAIILYWLSWLQGLNKITHLKCLTYCLTFTEGQEGVAAINSARWLLPCRLYLTDSLLPRWQSYICIYLERWVRGIKIYRANCVSILFVLLISLSSENTIRVMQMYYRKGKIFMMDCLINSKRTMAGCSIIFLGLLCLMLVVHSEISILNTGQI